jgi:ribonuclease HII
MVIAGVKILKRDEKKLIRVGVKDSKELSPKRREELAKKIEEIAKDIVVLRVQPCKIESYRAKGINLDKIEAMKMAQIIDMLDGSKIYVDSLEQNTEKFKNLILSFLQKKDYNLVVENYLDESIPVVSAASIIAKVNRDEAIKEIERKVGQPIGVGYSHDFKTIDFIKKLIKERKELPNFVRKSWITTKELQKQTWQKKLKDFIFGKEKCD